MQASKETRDGAAVLKVAGSMTIYEAGDLRAAFLEEFAANGGLVLDLEAVSECDTAGVQLLCSARVTAETETRTFRIEAVSSAVQDALAAAGLTLKAVLPRNEEV
ncbi:MAG: STAS domain-containing protein [Desulfococcaceae bacterium]